MPTFEPPVDNDVTYADFNQYWQPEDRLFSYVVPSGRGRNVYLKTDGSYTENQPEDDQVAKVYHGGHIIEITAAEAASLTAAGYGAYITG